jgi:hypothetical protein
MLTDEGLIMPTIFKGSVELPLEGAVEYDSVVSRENEIAAVDFAYIICLMLRTCFHFHFLMALP